jgi:hypothetical protein
MSSLENISAEAIQCLAFADSYTKKSGKLMLNLNELMIKPEERKGRKQSMWSLTIHVSRSSKNINV